MLWTYQIISSYRKTYFLNLYINETCKGRFFDNWHIINVVYWMNKFKTEKRNIFWEVKKLSKFFWQKATFSTCYFTVFSLKTIVRQSGFWKIFRPSDVMFSRALSCTLIWLPNLKFKSCMGSITRSSSLRANWSKVSR